MSQPSCDQAACTACVAGMSVEQEVVCEGAADQVLESACAFAIEGAGDDVVDDIFAAACGMAANYGCQVGYQIQWGSQQCADMFGNGACCGDTPTGNTCGTCPYDCDALSGVLSLVYNDQLPQAQTACEAVVDPTDFAAPYYTPAECGSMISAAQSFLFALQPQQMSNYGIMKGGLDAMYGAIHAGQSSYCSGCMPGCNQVFARNAFLPQQQQTYRVDQDAQLDAVNYVAAMVADKMASFCAAGPRMLVNHYSQVSCAPGSSFQTCDTNVRTTLTLASLSNPTL